MTQVDPFTESIDYAAQTLCKAQSVKPACHGVIGEVESDNTFFLIPAAWEPGRRKVGDTRSIDQGVVAKMSYSLSADLGV